MTCMWRRPDTNICGKMQYVNECALVDWQRHYHFDPILYIYTSLCNRNRKWSSLTIATDTKTRLFLHISGYNSQIQNKVFHLRIIPKPIDHNVLKTYYSCKTWQVACTHLYGSSFEWHSSNCCSQTWTQHAANWLLAGVLIMGNHCTHTYTHTHMHICVHAHTHTHIKESIRCCASRGFSWLQEITCNALLVV